MTVAASRFHVLTVWTNKAAKDTTYESELHKVNKQSIRDRAGQLPEAVGLMHTNIHKTSIINKIPSP